jgi:DNA polymerase III subunit delta'
MADSPSDPRETPLHPRLAAKLVGHDEAFGRMVRSFAEGHLHHAWLLCGPRGIGKSTFAYRFAAHILSARAPEGQAARWIAARAHPNLFVLERSLDPKNKRLKAEIAVEDVRGLHEFLGKTSSDGGWRVVIVDQADNLNRASANALLKAMEEPPSRTLLMLVCNNAGRIMPTIRSRCVSLNLHKLSDAETRSIAFPILEERSVDSATLEMAMTYGVGSPGFALEIAASAGAKAFAVIAVHGELTPALITEAAKHFSSRSITGRDFEIFTALLETWIARRARQHGLAGSGAELARAFAAIRGQMKETEAFNLDRRHAVVSALSEVRKALRAA